MRLEDCEFANQTDVDRSTLAGRDLMSEIEQLLDIAEWDELATIGVASGSGMSAEVTLHTLYSPTVRQSRDRRDETGGS